VAGVLATPKPSKDVSPVNRSDCSRHGCRYRDDRYFCERVEPPSVAARPTAAKDSAFHPGPLSYRWIGFSEDDAKAIAEGGS
jgi:hypothetical protein